MRLVQNSGAPSSAFTKLGPPADCPFRQQPEPAQRTRRSLVSAGPAPHRGVPPRKQRSEDKSCGPRWRIEPSSQSRSEEHTSELQSLMRISYAVFCLKKKTKKRNKNIE